MCQFCMTHGYGKVWYKNAQNYARQMYKLKKGTKAKRMERDPEGEAALIIAEAVEARGLDPENFPRLRHMASKASQEMIAGQVVTLEDAMTMVELASPIALMGCICRKISRGRLEDNEDSYTCMGLGIGMFKWDRWPERYKGGVQFVTVEEAKEWLTKWNKKGMVASLMTHGTPYIGGLCMCDYPDCLAIRYRLDYGINQMFKGEYVAYVNYGNCTGCGKCVERCQFGAIKFEITMNKTNIDQMRCFGCGVCRNVCKNDAIVMLDRNTLPGLKEVW
ncbi:MAG: 4Fe-4S binding protein [Bacillota bacterium]|nr:4Fe-4S binding protein [Bacillota bacterium]